MTVSNVNDELAATREVNVVRSEVNRNNVAESQGPNCVESRRSASIDVTGTSLSTVGQISKHSRRDVRIYKPNVLPKRKSHISGRTQSAGLFSEASGAPLSREEEAKSNWMADAHIFVDSSSRSVTGKKNSRGVRLLKGTTRAREIQLSVSSKIERDSTPQSVIDKIADHAVADALGNKQWIFAAAVVHATGDIGRSLIADHVSDLTRSIFENRRFLWAEASGIFAVKHPEFGYYTAAGGNHRVFVKKRVSGVLPCHIMDISLLYELMQVMHGKPNTWKMYPDDACLRVLSRAIFRRERGKHCGRSIVDELRSFRLQRLEYTSRVAMLADEGRKERVLNLKNFFEVMFSRKLGTHSIDLVAGSFHHHAINEDTVLTNYYDNKMHKMSGLRKLWSALESITSFCGACEAFCDFKPTKVHPRTFFTTVGAFSIETRNLLLRYVVKSCTPVQRAGIDVHSIALRVKDGTARLVENDDGSVQYVDVFAEDNSSTKSLHKFHCGITWSKRVGISSGIMQSQNDVNTVLSMKQVDSEVNKRIKECLFTERQLTKEENSVYETVLKLSSFDSDDLPEYLEFDGFRIQRDVWKELRPCEWLSDRLVSAGMRVLTLLYPDCIGVDSMITTLIIETYSGKRGGDLLSSNIVGALRDIGQYYRGIRIMFFPVHHGNHWTLLFCDFKQNCFVHYDPKHTKGMGKVAVTAVKAFLQLYFKRCESSETLPFGCRNVKKWKVLEMCAPWPLQGIQDSYNCGMFILVTALSVAHRCEPCVDALGISNARKQLLVVLLKFCKYNIDDLKKSSHWTGSNISNELRKRVELDKKEKRDSTPCAMTIADQEYSTTEPNFSRRRSGTGQSAVGTLGEKTLKLRRSARVTALRKQSAGWQRRNRSRDQESAVSIASQAAADNSNTEADSQLVNSIPHGHRFEVPLNQTKRYILPSMFSAYVSFFEKIYEEQMHMNAARISEEKKLLRDQLERKERESKRLQSLATAGKLCARRVLEDKEKVVEKLISLVEQFQHDNALEAVKQMRTSHHQVESELKNLNQCDPWKMGDTE